MADEKPITGSSPLGNVSITHRDVIIQTDGMGLIADRKVPSDQYIIRADTNFDNRADITYTVTVPKDTSLAMGGVMVVQGAEHDVFGDQMARYLASQVQQSSGTKLDDEAALRIMDTIKATSPSQLPRVREPKSR